MLAQSPQSGAKSPSRATPRSADFSRCGKKSAPKRVLVVDDEALVRWSIAETLGDQGYKVSEAADAAAAICIFSSPLGEVDLVLLDLRLPDSNDLRVLSAMRHLSPSTPVILMTAYGTPELVNEARRLGATAVVDKPFEMSDLAPLVERALADRPS
jgi:DNA-binding NtrC family response regulator